MVDSQYSLKDCFTWYLNKSDIGLIRDASFSPIIDTQRRRVSSIIDQSPLSSGDEYINWLWLSSNDHFGQIWLLIKRQIWPIYFSSLWWACQPLPHTILKLVQSHFSMQNASINSILYLFWISFYHSNCSQYYTVQVIIEIKIHVHCHWYCCRNWLLVVPCCTYVSSCSHTLYRYVCIFIVWIESASITVSNISVSNVPYLSYVLVWYELCL